jgi:hypothetical protein
MAKKKAESDVNATACEILKAVTGEEPCYASPMPTTKNRKEQTAHLPHNGTPKKKDPPAKNPAAVALGRLGGLKGGKARAEKLSPKKRTDIARRAAQARWHS